MNGPEVVNGAIGLPVGNPDVIAFLEQTLAEARAGQIVAVGIIKVPRPGVFNAGASGAPALCEINAGCDLLKQELMAAMRGNHRPSRIMRVGG